MKSFSKICRSEWTVNCRSRCSCTKIVELNIVGCERRGRNSGWKVPMTNYACTCVTYDLIRSLIIEIRYLVDVYSTVKGFRTYQQFIQFVCLKIEIILKILVEKYGNAFNLYSCFKLFKYETFSNEFIKIDILRAVIGNCF